MSTETTQNNVAATPPLAADAAAPTSVVPKQIVNAQTVCNEINEKKKLCNGHLKQLHTGGQGAEKHLRGDDALFKCQTCGTVYMGPPLGHLRDPDKQSRFVERELTDLLLAAGGTMPIIVKNEKGAYVLAEEATPHTAAPAAKAAPATTTDSAVKTSAKAATPVSAQPATAKGHAIKVGPIAGADGPVPGETREQKIERLKGVAAEAKRRAEAREAAAASGEVAPVEESHATEPVVSIVAAESAETAQDVASATVTEAESSPPIKSAPIPGADGPVPGETFEQKIERLKGVVAAARERAILEGRREA